MAAVLRGGRKSSVIPIPWGRAINNRDDESMKKNGKACFLILIKQKHWFHSVVSQTANQPEISPDQRVLKRSPYHGGQDVTQDMALLNNLSRVTGVGL